MKLEKEYIYLKSFYKVTINHINFHKDDTINYD